ncbi:MAG: ABC transporter permease, partial [Chloroflexia bacterium]
LAGIVLRARPPILEAQAVVRFDPNVYTFAIDRGGNIAPELLAEARSLLALRAPAGLLAVDRPGVGVDFLATAEPADESTRPVLVVRGRATDPEKADSLARYGAIALADALQSLRGWEILRTLLRQVVVLHGQGKTIPPSPLIPHLYEMLDAGLLAYDPSIPSATQVRVLDEQDVEDITLAVQRAEERHSARIETLLGQQARAKNPEQQAQIGAQVNALSREREVLRRCLMTLYRQREALIGKAGRPSRPQVNLPEALPKSRTGIRYPYLLAGGFVGLAFGALLAWLDEGFRLTDHLRELYTYRNLLWNLVVRDLKARYKSSVLGYLWSLVNPLLMVTVFTILFKFLLKSQIPNFPVFILAGLLPWNFCANSVSASVVSITGQSNLIKKVYFPREAIPIAVVLSNLINYLLALPAMFLLMLLLNAHFQPAVLLFPLIALIQTIFLMGIALFLSSLNVFFRDTQVIVEVLLLAWFFLTPIFYRLSDIVDERLARLVRWLNPMASLVDFYRDIFYLGGVPGWDAITRTLVTAALVLLGGYLFFLRLSPRLGEEL